MFRQALFNIIRQEQRTLADELEKEERSAAPDCARLVALRREVGDLRRELEHYNEV